MYRCTHKYMYILYIHAHAYVYIYMLYTYMISLSMYLYICLYIHLSLYIYIHLNMYIYIYIYIHMQIYMHLRCHVLSLYWRIFVKSRIYLQGFSQIFKNIVQFLGGGGTGPRPCTWVLVHGETDFRERRELSEAPEMP